VHFESPIVKLRVMKAYPEAHNHLLVGFMTGWNDVLVRLECRTFHFGRTATRPTQVREGERGNVVIPWARVEIVTELAEKFHWSVAELVAKEGGVLLTDGTHTCSISTGGDEHF